jgi:hypothetical protein
MSKSILTRIPLFETFHESSKMAEKMQGLANFTPSSRYHDPQCSRISPYYHLRI